MTALKRSLSPSHRHQRPPVAFFFVALISIMILLGASMLWFWQNSSNDHKSTLQPTPTARIFTSATAPANALFYDTFMNNNYGWDLDDDKYDGYYRILVNHTLILTATVPNTTLVESVPITNTDLSDYVFSADFTISLGSDLDRVSFYLRGDSDLNNDYRVDIYANNTFDVAREWLDQNPEQAEEQTTLLTTPEYTDLLKPPGQQNTLTVTMLGSTIVVAINNIVAAQISNSAYTSGQIALALYNSDSPNGIIASFTRIEVDRLTLGLAAGIRDATA